MKSWKGQICNMANGTKFSALSAENKISGTLINYNNNPEYAGKRGV
jgi:hypothetical protein